MQPHEAAAMPTAEGLVFPKLIDPPNISITSTTAVINQGEFQRIVLEVRKHDVWSESKSFNNNTRGFLYQLRIGFAIICYLVENNYAMIGSDLATYTKGWEA
jgi:hypothetical protein